MTGSMGRRGAAMVGAGLFALSLAAAPAMAADDGYQNVFTSVLGAVGVIKADPPPEIEYRERAPLVLPPSASLPKPIPKGARRAAAWPQDPDELRHRKEGEEARAPHGIGPQNSDRGVLLSKEEMLKGRGAGEPVRSNECGNDGNQRGCLIVSPDELKAEGERYRAANPEKSDTIVAGQEPPREYLTEPPKGYLKPVKTVKATAEAPEEKVDLSNPREYMRTGGKQPADQ